MTLEKANKASFLNTSINDLKNFLKQCDKYKEFKLTGAYLKFEQKQIEFKIPLTLEQSNNILEMFLIDNRNKLADLEKQLNEL